MVIRYIYLIEVQPALLHMYENAIIFDRAEGAEKKTITWLKRRLFVSFQNDQNMIIKDARRVYIAFICWGIVCHRLFMFLSSHVNGSRLKSQHKLPNE